MIFDPIRRFIGALRGQRAFSALPQSQRKIVFYAEDSQSLVHFESIIRQLFDRFGEPVCYLTSAPDDPLLTEPLPGMKVFYVGDGLVRTIVFTGLRADLLVMTMPDLGNYHIKRSQNYPVHYLYLFHAMVSTHSNYRKAAFDHFDTIFCTGPYQMAEIRKTEEVYGLRPKALYADGYRRLESMMEQIGAHRESTGNTPLGEPRTVVIAPSWGEHAILESGLVFGLAERLLEAGYITIVRPHPMTTKNHPEILEALNTRFGENVLFGLQLDIRDKRTLFDSHVMISDWSGVALEYAFACERPVLFLDVPKKCNNPESERIGIIPVEVSLRERLGRVISPDALDTIPQAIEQIYGDRAAFVEQIRQTREASVYNLGNSLDGAVEKIVEIVRVKPDD